MVAQREIGKSYDGKVVKVVDFGAFVNFLGPRDGLVHISELAPERVNTVTDVVKEGDAVKVKCIGMDRGKVKLSMKRVNQETGEDLEATARQGLQVRREGTRPAGEPGGDDGVDGLFCVPGGAFAPTGKGRQTGQG